jgi:hypothetical protein
MIRVKALSEGEWLVTVEAATVTNHRVSVSAADVQRLGVPAVSTEKVLEASFRFLLDREPNTSILSSFELPLISRYFPEYAKELPRYLGAAS